MSPCGTQQIQSVGFWFREGLLVTKNDSGGIVLDTAQRDKPAPLRFPFPSRHGEMLRVGVDRGLGILEENTLAAPIEKKGSGARIDILVHIVRRLPLAEDNAHEVVWACGVISFLHYFGNLVIRLGNHLGEGNAFCVIPESAKRGNVGHGRRLCILARARRGSSGSVPKRNWLNKLVRINSIERPEQKTEKELTQK